MCLSENTNLKKNQYQSVLKVSISLSQSFTESSKLLSIIEKLGIGKAIDLQNIFEILQSDIEKMLVSVDWKKNRLIYFFDFLQFLFFQTNIEQMEKRIKY